MTLDVVFLIFALVDGIAFAVLANDYKNALLFFNSGAFGACSVIIVLIYIN